MSRPDVSTVALSMGRSNGKSLLAARLAAAHLMGGPEESECVLVASSYSQAKVIDRYARRMLASRHVDVGAPGWTNRESANVSLLRCPTSGRAIRALSNDPRKAHGRIIGLALLDEPREWSPGTRDRMMAALTTGLDKVPGATAVAIGTQPPEGEGHWFTEWLEGAADVSRLYSAPRDLDPFALETIRLANPSFDHLPTLRAGIRKQSERAERLGGRWLASYRALVLNQGTSDVERAYLVEWEDWEAVEGPELPPAEGEYFLGVDLGGGASMSAAAAYFPETGRLEAWASLPRRPSLEERGRRDGVGRLYADMAGEGDLILCPIGEQPAWLLEQASSRYGRAPAVISSDRWRQAEIGEALDAAGAPEGIHLDARGQGWKDGGEDVRRFRRRVLAGEVRALPRLLIRAALREARTVSDPAGNEKLSKGTEGGRRRKARDDVAAAIVQAVSSADRLYDPEAAAEPWFAVVQA